MNILYDGKEWLVWTDSSGGMWRRNKDTSALYKMVGSEWIQQNFTSSLEEFMEEVERDIAEILGCQFI
jgi:hypothetical protein